MNTQRNKFHSPLTIIQLVYTEYVLLAITVILKFSLFYKRMGTLRGDDSFSFIQTVRTYTITGPLPALDTFLTSYHPPMSFLIIKMTELLMGVDEILASQILSYFCLLGSFLLLRSILKKIHMLHTVHGIVFLYLTASVPLFVQLATDSTYDTLVLLLGVATLDLSIKMFWHPEFFSLKNNESRKNMLLLFMILTVGLFTKYSCILYFSVPFFVLLIRCNKQQIIKNAVATSLVCILAVGVVAPFYYQHYYVQTGDWMPMGMDLRIPGAISKIRKNRNTHKIAFTMHMMRVPLTHISDMSTIGDSLPQEVWYEIWKPRRPFYSGSARYMPDIYLYAFIPLFLIGMTIFAVRYRRRGNETSDFGWILTACAAIFLLSLLYFGYSYPYFVWKPFKAKYVPFAVIWITYLCSLGITASFKKFNVKRFPALSSSAAISLVTAMIILNHTIPA